MVLLSLRRRRKHGPTLPSRLVGAAEDCRLLLAMRFDALLDKRRIKLPLLAVPRASAMAPGPGLVTGPWAKEVALVFRERIGSGSWKLGGHGSSSLPRIGSGEPWTDELVVRTAVSGDMMGEPCWELEATEEAEIAETGAVAGCVGDC